MKHAILIALLLGPMVFEAPAQQSQAAVAVPAGPAPTATYVWITLRGFNGIDVRRPDGSRVLPPLTGNGLNLPYDIVGIPSLHRVFISNNGAAPGTISVFDSDTLQPVGVIQVPGSRLLKGMSVSEDQGAVFVAGESLVAGTLGPSVFQFDPVTLTPAVRVAGTLQAGVAAEDCVVIRAANVGGSGNGPGKLYWSVRLPGTTGYIGIRNFIGASPPSISTGQAPLINIENADSMDRTPDHRSVFIGATKRNPPASGPNCQIIKIDTLTDAAITTVVRTGIQDLTNNRTFDVTWRVDGGNNRGFVLVQQDNGTREVVEIDDLGAPVAPPVPCIPGVTPITLRFGLLSEQLYVGEIGTSNTYNYFSAAAGAAVGPATAQAASATDPLNFAVMSTPAVVISDITPRGAPVGTLVTVRGVGFQQTLTGTSGGTGVGVTWIDSNTATVDFAAVGVGLHDLVLVNPNVQQGAFGGFYQAFTPPAPQTHQLVLPSLLQGYQMLSVPQYASLTTLKAVFESTLGPYNPVLYRVFFYRNGQYVEMNQLADDGCDIAGESFWVLTRNGAMTTLTEPDVRVTSGLLDDRVVPLSPGFNMVSLPLLNGGGPTGSIQWTLMHVTDDESNFAIGSPGGPVNVTSAQGLALVEQAVEYVNGSYFLAPNLIAGQGVWVRNITTGPVYLVFDQFSVMKPGAPSSAPGVPPPAGSMPPGPPSGVSNAGSGSGGCGLLGAELLFLLVLCAVRRGRLGA